MLYDKLKTASRLKELRIEKGYTMQDIAKKLDLKSHGTYSDIEHGKNILTSINALKLANLYNVSLDYIYGLSNNKNNNNLININELDNVLKTGITYNGKTLTSTDIIALKAFLQGLTSSK
ncbi:MAG: helix-turn-helix transcriptional regulator [Ligilactobacillus salivarius]|nr:helix-turn-helix transcriptional regulator [Ligilactobacillus salivarius]